MKRKKGKGKNPDPVKIIMRWKPSFERFRCGSSPGQEKMNRMSIFRSHFLHLSLSKHQRVSCQNDENNSDWDIEYQIILFKTQSSDLGFGKSIYDMKSGDSYVMAA